jgi:hypothetical protein
MKPQNKKRQANLYDKIFKENIEAVISSIMQNVLEITAISLVGRTTPSRGTVSSPDIVRKQNSKL